MPEKTAFFYFYLTFCLIPGEISGLTTDNWLLASTNPGAGEDTVAVVKHRGLAGGDGALGCVECDVRAIVIESVDRGRSRLVLVANFDGGANRARWPLYRDPVHILDIEGLLTERFVLA